MFRAAVWIVNLWSPCAEWLSTSPPLRLCLTQAHSAFLSTDQKHSRGFQDKLSLVLLPVFSWVTYLTRNVRSHKEELVVNHFDGGEGEWEGLEGLWEKTKKKGIYLLRVCDLCAHMSVACWEENWGLILTVPPGLNVTEVDCICKKATIINLLILNLSFASSPERFLFLYIFSDFLVIFSYCQ